MPRTSKKPEKDQAATEIANEEETRAASVTDGLTVGEAASNLEGDDIAQAETGEDLGAPPLVSREEIEETAEALLEEEVERPVTDLLDEALAELGEPDGSYPAPIVNAIELIRSAQAALQSDGLFITEEVEVTGEIEVELFSPGEVCPTSGLWRPVGSESALSRGDRFPPPSIATGWMQVQSADQGDD